MGLSEITSTLSVNFSFNKRMISNWTCVPASEYAACDKSLLKDSAPINTVTSEFFISIFNRNTVNETSKVCSAFCVDLFVY